MRNWNAKFLFLTVSAEISYLFSHSFGLTCKNKCDTLAWTDIQKQKFGVQFVHGNFTFGACLPRLRAHHFSERTPQWQIIWEIRTPNFVKRALQNLQNGTIWNDTPFEKTYPRSSNPRRAPIKNGISHENIMLPIHDAKFNRWPGLLNL